MGVTLKDIAKMANVSHATVARALNNSGYINEKTKERILNIVKEMKYSSNISAKSLVTNKSYNVGLFFSSMSQRTSPGFFYEMLGGVNSVIGGSYNLVVREVGHETEFLTIDKNRFDGILLVSQSESDNAFIKDVLQKEIPLVVLNRELDDPSIPNVLPAEKKGSYEAIKFLIKNGHTDIAVIEGAKGFKSSINRKEGYLQAMQENKIPVRDEYMVCGNYTIESGHTAMNSLLQLPKRPTAVFAFNDDMAVGAMKAIFEAGLKVPGDISMIGFDGNVECDYVTPPLTTVSKRSRDISIKGAEKLLGLINGDDSTGEKIYINTELIIRDSVKKLKKAAHG